MNLPYPDDLCPTRAGTIHIANFARIFCAVKGRFTQDAGVHRIADNSNMKNVHISFSVWVQNIELNSLSPLILRLDREENASPKRKYNFCLCAFC